MNPDHRFVIEGWMLTECRLEGRTLLLYAVLYSFSRKAPVLWSYTAMSAYTGLAYSSLRRSVKLLRDKGLLLVEKKGSDVLAFRAVHQRLIPADEQLLSDQFLPLKMSNQNEQPIGQNEQVIDQNEQVIDQNEQPIAQNGAQNRKRKEPKEKGSPVGSPNTHTKCAKVVNNNVNSFLFSKDENEQKKDVSVCSWEELLAYARKRGIADDISEAFYTYYSANGWMMGCNPVKNWMAALASWKKHPKQQKAPPTAPPLTDDERRAIKETRQRLADAEEAARAANLADARSEETLAAADAFFRKHGK